MHSLTIFGVFRQLIAEPREMLLRRWNWKSALFSSLIRAAIFFFANLTAGWRAASGAMLAEFLYRAVFAGFYGSLTQAFRKAHPAWAANLTVMVLLPLISHAIELLVHLLRGTPNLRASIIVSLCFTVVSTLFNIFAMRRGALIVGAEARTVASDLRQVPRLILEFAMAAPLALFRWVPRFTIKLRNEA